MDWSLGAEIKWHFIVEVYYDLTLYFHFGIILFFFMKEIGTNLLLDAWW